MNAIPMIAHCGFHQRVLNRVPVCPLCGGITIFDFDHPDYIGTWVCPRRCTFAVPVWRDTTLNDCPYVENHRPSVENLLLTPPTL